MWRLPALIPTGTVACHGDIPHIINSLPYNIQRLLGTFSISDKFFVTTQARSRGSSWVLVLSSAARSCLVSGPHQNGWQETRDGPSRPFRVIVSRA
ncbi:hypothetical protein K440DRAFT_35269 [Wilcoxina mikolae CBS 423.85]|nr:hypothetical protein K440DRAFT_35269 [Wilcoxina mikolae CBS 423.85]